MADINATLTNTIITATVTNDAEIAASLGVSTITATVTSGDNITATVTESPITATLVSGGNISASITESPITATITLGLDDAPSNGSTYGRQDAAWVVVEGGDISEGGTGGVVGRVAEFVTDDKTLQAAALIAPAVNILTLTNAAAATLALNITTGKTLTLTAADNYTLTIPETGTAALLARANVFIAAQTITPASNSTSVFKITQADTTEFFTADSTNKFLRVGSGGKIQLYRPDNTTRAINFYAGASNSFFSVEVGDFSFEALAGRNIFYASSLHRFDKPTTTNNAVLEVVRLNPTVSTSSTGGAAGFGAGLSFYAETATDGTNQQQGLISTSWVDATNATRKAKLSLSAYDTAARLGLEIEASGSAVKLGFFGGTTAIQQVLAAYTSDAESGAYTGIDNTQAGTVYATVADLNTLRVAYETLRASYDDLRTKLQTSTIVG